MGTQDISQQLKRRRINLNYTGVRRALGDLGIVQKMPKLRAQGSMVKNYKKRQEIRRYKQIAAALLKKIAVDFKTKNGLNFFPSRAMLASKRKVLHIPTLGYNK